MASQIPKNPQTLKTLFPTYFYERILEESIKREGYGRKPQDVLAIHPIKTKKPKI